MKPFLNTTTLVGFMAVSVCILLTECRQGMLPGENRSASPAVFPANTAAPETTEKVSRYGSVIRLMPEKYEFYKELHAHPWKEVDSLLRMYHIRNYSIYLK